MEILEVINLILLSHAIGFAFGYLTRLVVHRRAVDRFEKRLVELEDELKKLVIE